MHAAPYTCKFCGLPSWTDPADQEAPFDVCDHRAPAGPCTSMCAHQEAIVRCAQECEAALYLRQYTPESDAARLTARARQSALAAFMWSYTCAHVGCHEAC